MLECRPGCVGVDEAGRGPLAGPVVVAAVMIPPEVVIEGLNDSKKLTPARREALAPLICERAKWAVEVVPPEEIDRANILRATLGGMARATLALEAEGWTVALVDGSILPPELIGRGEALVKGDARIAEIAAASILAKTTRDAIMTALDTEYPGYGFAAHFGYGTPAPLEALKRLGPCPIHRRSFAPVRATLRQ